MESEWFDFETRQLSVVQGDKSSLAVVRDIIT